MKDKKRSFTEKFIEWLLWHSRFLLIIPVFIFLLLWILLIFIAIKKLFLIVWWLDNLSMEFVFWNIVTLIDLVLLTLILFIFSWWVYELFIDEIDIKDCDKSKAKFLVINSIDELKEILWRVIVIMLIVNLFKIIIDFQVLAWYDLLSVSASILIVALSIRYISK